MTDKKSSEIQLEASYYFTKDYCTPQRLSGYAYQFAEVIDCGAGKILEIGAGAGVLTYLLRKADRHVDTLDHDPELKPDIVASLLDIPVADDSYDIVLCCQVLEHLPWEVFVAALEEFKRIASKTIIISVPHITKNFYIDVKLPKLGRVFYKKEFELNRKVEDGSEHFWEIGRGVKSIDIIDCIEKCGLKLIREYRPPEFDYHHFYIIGR